MIDNIDELFKLYYRPLCLYSLHYVADIDLAEDIVQDCFAELWQRICMNSDITNIKQYMYSMVRNKSIDSLRKESLIDHDIQISDIGSYIFDENEIDRSEQEAKLWTSIEALPPKRREIFLLNKHDGMKYKDIARKLGISENTVENQISKALKALKSGAKNIYNFIFA